MHRDRPTGIILVAIWSFLAGLGSAIYGAAVALAFASLFSLLGLLSSSFNGLQLVFNLAGLILVLSGIGLLVVGWGLLEGKEWARTWGIVAFLVVGIVSILFSLLPLLVGGGFLFGYFAISAIPGLLDLLAAFYLFSEEARGYFSEGFTQEDSSWEPSPTITPEPQPIPVPVPTVRPAPERTQLVSPSTAVLGWLVASSGVHRGKRFELGQETIIGRDPSVCNIVLSDGTVSRQHCKVRLEGRRYYVYDLGSTAGTYLNQHKIQRSQLMDNDRVRLGSTELIFKETKT